MKPKTLYAVVVSGAVIGLVASFWETLEDLALLKNSHAILSCNLNSVFSCTNVLNAWQSSVFHFPNSLMCMTFFTLTIGAGLVGLTGSKLNRALRLSLQGLALFFLGFGLWFLEQSTFSINALCIFCVFCFGGLLAINAAWLRLNTADIIDSPRWHHRLQRSLTSGLDIFIWCLLAIIVAGVMILHFR